MKTLADFKQEVLQKRYPNYNVDGHFIMTLELFDEAAELYAAYRAQEMEETAYEKGFKDGVNESAPDGFVFTLKAEYDKAWNEALHWAAEKLPHESSGDYWRELKQVILKGLKP